MIIDFKPYHFTAARLSPEIRAKVAPKIEHMDHLAKHFMAGTSVVHRPNETRILGIVGVVPSNSTMGAGEVFVLPTEDRKKYPVEFARDVKGALKYARGHFAKIQALGEKDTPFYTRWFNFLGMHRTEEMKGGEVVWETA